MYKYRWHIFGLTLNFPLKISTIVRKDRAKMEEIAQMLWMIITVAVFLASRAIIVVLVSHFRPFYLIVYFTECMIFVKSSPCFPWFFELSIVSPRINDVRESKTVLDSWFQVLDSKSSSVELAFWIPVVCGIPDSLSCIPDSKSQDSGFHEQLYPRNQIPGKETKAVCYKL